MAKPVNENTKCFNKSLRKIVAPVLKEEGYVFDGSRTFRLVSDDGSTSKIVNFQLGQRSAVGTFTVNLAIFEKDSRADVDVAKAYEYDCDARVRLGLLIPPKWPRLANLPVVGWLFNPKDRWWSFSANPTVTDTNVKAALQATIQHGIPWLESRKP